MVAPALRNKTLLEQNVTAVRPVQDLQITVQYHHQYHQVVHIICLVQEQICTAVCLVQDLQDQKVAHLIAPKVTYLRKA
jgi:hypothetical protein